MLLRAPPKTPAALGDILQGALSGLTNPGLALTMRLDRDWKKLVGEAIARHSRVLSASNGCICIGVDNSVWMAELNARKDEIRSRINAALPDCATHALRFKITTMGPVGTTPTAKD
jgi:predicted nucleic acid-binding Zn ribbon protein